MRAGAADRHARQGCDLAVQRVPSLLAAEPRHVPPRRGGRTLAQVLAGERALAGQDRLDRPLGHHLAAVLAGRRPEVDHVVGAADERPVVLDDEHGVAALRQVAQQQEEAVAVLRVEADGRLVEDIEGAGQPGAQGGGEVDALGLAAGEGAGLAVQGEVVEPHPVEDLDALGQLVEQVARRFALPRAPWLRGEPGAQGLDAHPGEVGEELVLQAHGERLGLQAGAAAVRAWVVGAVAGEEHADVDLVGLRLQPAEELVEVGEGPLAAPDPRPVLGRQLAPGHVERDPPLLRRGEETVVQLLIGRRVPRRDGALGEAAPRIGDDPLAVDADHPAEPLAARAGTERGVEREEGRSGAAGGLAAHRAGELAAEVAHAPRAARLDPAVAEVPGLLQGVDDARPGRGPRREPAEDERQRVERRGPGGARLHAHHLLAVEAALEPLADQLAEGVVRGPLVLAAGARQAHQQEERIARGTGEEVVRRLFGRPGAHRPMALGTAHRAQMGVEEAQDVHRLGDRPDRRAGVAHRVLGLQGDGGEDVADVVHRRPFHLVQELPGIGGHRLDEPPLPFGEDGVEGERRLAGARGTGDHRHRPVGNPAVDPFEIVRAGALDEDGEGRRHP